MSAVGEKGFRWERERRLEIIEYCLFSEAGIKRSDLFNQFGLSVQQASTIQESEAFAAAHFEAMR